MISLQSLIIAVVSIFGVIILIGAFVITYIFAKRSVKNNPENAIVILKNGTEGEGFRAKLEDKTKNGYRYGYKVRGKPQKVILPRKYTPFYVKNNLWIFVDRIGDVISSPFNGENTLDDTEKANLIYEIIESGIGRDVVRAIKRTGKTVGIAVIAIVVIIAIVIVAIGYNYINNSGALNSTQSTQKIEQPVEVK